MKFAQSWRIRCFQSILFMLFLGHNFSAYAENDAISKNLEKLTSLEKEYLQNFFKFGFFVSTFGYTIFGNKPMSIETINMCEGCRSVDGFDYMDLEHILNRYRLKEGWEVWKKYSNYFPLEGFSVIHYKQPVNQEYIEIALINHNNFIRTVNEYFDDFRSVLKQELTAEQILIEYLKGSGPIFQCIRCHDGLFGTLLGYGRQNSWEFMKRSEEKIFRSFSSEDPKDTMHVLPPLFGVIENSDETKALRISYEKQRQAIDIIYQRGDFLECVLERMTVPQKTSPGFNVPLRTATRKDREQREGRG